MFQVTDIPPNLPAQGGRRREVLPARPEPVQIRLGRFTTPLVDLIGCADRKGQEPVRMQPCAYRGDVVTLVCALDRTAVIEHDSECKLEDRKVVRLDEVMVDADTLVWMKTPPRNTSPWAHRQRA